MSNTLSTHMSKPTPSLGLITVLRHVDKPDRVPYLKTVKHKEVKQLVQGHVAGSEAKIPNLG